MKQFNKKNLQIFHNINNIQQDVVDSLVTKLTQTKALLLIGSDIDFSSYDPCVQQDYFGATLESMADLSSLIPKLMEKPVEYES